MFLTRSFRLGCTLVSLMLGTLASAQGATEWPEVSSQVEAQVGVDVWSLHPSIGQDASFQARGNTYLLQPNASTKNEFRHAAPWARVVGRWALGGPITVSLRARGDQLMGLAVDQAAVDFTYAPLLGVSLGVLDYKTSWCGTYETDSPWISDPNPMCNNRFAAGTVGGAPGVQAHSSIQWDDYRVHAIAGAYNPLLFGFNSTEFGNVANEKSSILVQKNKKWGASLNVVNLDTGTEFRLSNLQTRQIAVTPGDTIDGPSDQVASLWHLGLARTVGTATRLRYTFTHASQTLRFVENQASVTIPISRATHTVEAAHSLGSRDVLAIGVTRLQEKWVSGQDFYFSYHRRDLAWRHDWGRGVHTALHWMYSSQIHGYPRRPIETASTGHAVGFRLGYAF